jgi:nitrate/nitrite transport system substrate-binding protein
VLASINRCVFLINRLCHGCFSAALLCLVVAGCGGSDVTLEDLESAVATPEATPEAPLSAAASVAAKPSEVTTILAIEKPDLKFGFIKLTDCAPLVIAKEKGFFDDEGLNVELEAQANWKVLLDGVINGQLDGAHMLAGQHHHCL